MTIYTDFIVPTNDKNDPRLSIYVHLNVFRVILAIQLCAVLFNVYTIEMTVLSSSILVIYQVYLTIKMLNTHTYVPASNFSMLVEHDEDYEDETEADEDETEADEETEVQEEVQEEAEDEEETEVEEEAEEEAEDEVKPEEPLSFDDEISSTPLYSKTSTTSETSSAKMRNRKGKAMIA